MSIVVMAGCSGKKETGAGQGGQTQAAVQSTKNNELENPSADGVLVDYEKEGLLTLMEYKGIPLSKKDLKDEDLSEEEMAGESAWETVVDGSDVTDYPQSLVDEEYEITKKQYEDMAELLGGTMEDLLQQFGMDEDGLYEVSEDQVKQRMIAKTIAYREKIELDEDTYISSLREYMEIEEGEEKTKEELEEEYVADYGNHPKDDMYIELVKKYIAKEAIIS